MSEELPTEDNNVEESKSSRAAVIVAVVSFVILCCLCLLASSYVLFGSSDDEQPELELAEEPQATEVVPTEDTANIVSFGTQQANTPELDLASSSDKSVPTVDIPFPTATPKVVATALPLSYGSSRANPHALNELVNAPNWNIKILDVVQGDEAWAQIQAADSFFSSPAPEGMAYVLVKISTVSTYADLDPHTIGGVDFGITGDNLKYYSATHVLDMEGVLDAELLTGEEAEGWIVFLLDEHEDNLILVFEEFWNFSDDYTAYIAVDEGASIAIDPGLFELNSEFENQEQSTPVPLGDIAVSENWEIAVLDVVRGAEAWTMIQNANQFNEPPADSMEYIALDLSVRNIDSAETVSYIDSSLFNTTGSRGIEYDSPFVLGPTPQLNASLYPGGRHQGWLILQAGEDEEGVVLSFDPSFADHPTQFSLE